MKLLAVAVYKDWGCGHRVVSCLLLGGRYRYVNNQSHERTNMSDWDTPTIIGSKARAGGSGPRAQVARTSGQINAARRQGLVLSVDKKYSSSNAKGNNEGQRLTKIDRDTDIVKLQKLDPAVGRAISQSRTEKKLSQKDLATKINEKPTVINDYEAGRAAPNQQILGKLERALGIKLRGKDIGAPLGPKKK